jgi:hypothetical protein
MTNHEFRYHVAFFAALLGIVVAGVDFFVDPPPAPPGPLPPEGVRREPTVEEHRRIFEVCIVFYGATYSAGRLIYRFLGARSEADVLHRGSKLHMLVLNLVGGGWLLISGVPAIQQAIFRPSLLVGLTLIGVAVYDFVRDLRSKPLPQTEVRWKQEDVS